MNATFTHFLFFRMVHHATLGSLDSESFPAKLASPTSFAQRCLINLRVKSHHGSAPCC
jgi:hypothetical protein